MPLILLAEDESSTIDHVRSALASQGWLVKTVGTRDQALRAASEFAPQLVLVNDTLSGAEDLIRTFSRRSGGPGVVLLTSDDASDSQATAASADVDALLAKPLNTADLIETIRRGLVDGEAKPTPPPVADTNKVFSSQEIFGDLLDDILDPEAEAETEGVDASSVPPAVADAELKADMVQVFVRDRGVGFGGRWSWQSQHPLFFFSFFGRSISLVVVPRSPIATSCLCILHSGFLFGGR